VTGEDAPRALYLVLLLMLVTASLIGMRLPAGKVVKMALAWIAIFAGAFALFAFRDEFSTLGQRLRAEATGAPIEAGEELRIPISEDGHFWVEASINGHSARFLVDSGASITTVSRATAEAARVSTGMRSDQVETANGIVSMPRGTAERFSVGPIERTSFSVNVNNRDSANVIGMNFLSSLRSWRVEGNYLVLRP
jgi:aspartyl protease family protein